MNKQAQTNGQALPLQKASITRKRFSEKPIVAFTNSTVLILDFNIYD